MFICLVPKISQVMLKWRHRASHLSRFTLWHNGHRASQLGRFTLWYTMVNTCFHISNCPWREEPGKEFRSRILTVQAELPIFLDRLFTCQFYGLIPPIDSFFPWNVKYKTIKVLQVCSTSSTVCKSIFYILTYSGASSYGSKSIVPCVTLFP